MAYLGEDRVLLFGGWDNSYVGQTWVYDLSANSWTDQAPGRDRRESRGEAEWAAPSARFGHAMASLGAGEVLLFGGSDGSRNGDTWVYDLSANIWTDQNPASSPSARLHHAMASIGGDQVLLFGGDIFNNGETWLASGFYGGDRTYLPLVFKLSP